MKKREHICIECVCRTDVLYNSKLQATPNGCYCKECAKKKAKEEKKNA